MFKQLLGLGLVLVSLGAIAVPVRAVEVIPTEAEEYAFAKDVLFLLADTFPNMPMTLEQMYILLPFANRYCEVRRGGGTDDQVVQAYVSIRPATDSAEVADVKDHIFSATMISAGFNICPDIRAGN
jgi:hypothetical protein